MRMDKRVCKHCKFERRPVEEMVYQLSDTDHLVFTNSSDFNYQMNKQNFYMDPL
jgi:hypothetical protein